MRRPSIATVDAASIQGDGARVQWKRMTWGERRDILKEYHALAPDEKSDYLVKYLYTHLVDWNFVDDHGEPLPCPRCAEDESGLYDEEVTFLYSIASRALQGELELTPDSLKN